MRQIVLMLITFLSCVSIHAGFGGHKNSEKYSPKKNYEFALSDIQETVRSAVTQADELIAHLTETNEIDVIAQRYFDDYLSAIASYNDQAPQTVDLVEAYKTDLVNAYVLREFKTRYPHVIYDRSKWMFNSVGGIYANMIIMHCSLKEYVVLWGTTIRADNKFSGFYPFMNEFDVMTRGVMESHDVDAKGHAAVIYRPIIQDGEQSMTVDTSNLIPNNVRSYNLAAHTYMVSYAQGNMLKAFFPGAIMPGTFVNQDWGGLKLHISESIKSFLMTKKRQKSLDDWKKNPNYRALWIIDEMRLQK